MVREGGGGGGASAFSAGASSCRTQQQQPHPHQPHQQPQQQLQPQPINKMRIISVATRRGSAEDFLRTLNSDWFLSRMLLVDEERLQSRCRTGNTALHQPNGSVPLSLPQPASRCWVQQTNRSNNGSMASALAVSPTSDANSRTSAAGSMNYGMLPAVISHDALRANGRTFHQAGTHPPRPSTAAAPFYSSSAPALGQDVSSTFNSNNAERPPWLREQSPADASSPRVSRFEPATATSAAITATIVGAVSRLAADVVVADAIVRADRIIQQRGTMYYQHTIPFRRQDAHQHSERVVLQDHYHHGTRC